MYTMRQVPRDAASEIKMDTARALIAKCLQASNVPYSKKKKRPPMGRHASSKVDPMRAGGVQVTADFAKQYTPGHVVNDTKQLGTRARKKAEKEARRASR
jgi:hypothetical protein